MGAPHHGGTIHRNLPLAPVASGHLRIVRMGVSGVAVDNWGRGVGGAHDDRDSGVGAGRTAQSLNADSGTYGRRPALPDGAHVRRRRMESRVLACFGIWSRTVSGNHGYGAGGVARGPVTGG